MCPERGKMLNENFRDMLSAFSEAGADYHLCVNKLASGRDKDQQDPTILKGVMG